MRIYRFDFPGSQYVNVAAPTVREAFQCLNENDYFGLDDDDALSWEPVPDDATLRVRCDDDPDELMLGQVDARWDPAKRTLSMSAKSWAASCEVPSIVSDSEA